MNMEKKEVATKVTTKTDRENMLKKSIYDLLSANDFTYRDAKKLLMDMHVEMTPIALDRKMD
ncbi:hypothetical protein ACFSKI_18990 [Pseudogracilibacillus auburnensis]|uniref:Uncharacterized protein n=1 Tax=Pseudogracilibacillus auburnensis TaxID=1494959 RepID=A0A2V3W3W1_9BACI|nr:hypothetical protein [Pseudogracilibacillus auburnensis]PXW88782.1 hypothetical protein DFR56_103288 [Pseudogracilibacillus auburnensis]